MSFCNFMFALQYHTRKLVSSIGPKNCKLESDTDLPDRNESINLYKLITGIQTHRIAPSNRTRHGPDNNHLLQCLTLPKRST